ncbi:hypothetical protein COT68_01945, partial [bacterium (Candidatus Torokbacteria) CG09_land_8_20_14_0_10_42_11]
LSDLAQYTQKILLPAIEKRLEGFVTKKDAEKFASKADLTIMELDLREEIKNCVTREEFNERFDQVMTSLDKVIKNQEDWRQENTMQAAQNRRFNDSVCNHEKRITKLELKLKPA